MVCLSRASRNRLAEYFADRFGVDPLFWEEFTIYEKKGSIWVASAEYEPDDAPMASGLRALRDTNLGLKPTTYFLQFLDDAIERNVYELDGEELEQLVFERETIECDMGGGYVALQYRGRIIGCGLVTSRGLETQIPKSRGNDLEAML